MAKINLVAPWDEYYNRMVAFFKDDPGVTILYDDSTDEKQIKVLVQQSNKAEALTNLLNTEKNFGNVKLNITVIPANGSDTKAKALMASLHANEGYASEYRHAFYSNDILEFVYTVDGVMGFTATYVTFAKKVIQYYSDNLSDLNGMKSTLAENIARDIFVPHNGVFFCTDTQDVNKQAQVAYTLSTN